MSKVDYNKRVWLNGENSHYTGGVVCFDGEGIVNRGKVLERYTFVEIADCHGKVRIHKDDNLDMKEFIGKLKLFEEEIRRFREFLEGKDENNS